MCDFAHAQDCFYSSIEKALEMAVANFSGVVEKLHGVALVSRYAVTWQDYVVG